MDYLLFYEITIYNSEKNTMQITFNSSLELLILMLVFVSAHLSTGFLETDEKFVYINWVFNDKCAKNMQSNVFYEICWLHVQYVYISHLPSYLLYCVIIVCIPEPIVNDKKISVN
jgi:hypothetical protein